MHSIRIGKCSTTVMSCACFPLLTHSAASNLLLYLSGIDTAFI
jgi:hypothetical protein